NSKQRESEAVFLPRSPAILGPHGAGGAAGPRCPRSCPRACGAPESCPAGAACWMPAAGAPWVTRTLNAIPAKIAPNTIAEMLKPVRTNRFVIRCSLEFSEYFATYHRHAEPYKLQFQIPMIHQYLSNDHARRNKAER